MIKKWLMLLSIAILLAGCGTAAQRSEFWKHDTMYKNWTHMAYSWSGYKKTSADDVQKTKSQNWWGISQSVAK